MNVVTGLIGGGRLIDVDEKTCTEIGGDKNRGI
jgi:hypothetical protein